MPLKNQVMEKAGEVLKIITEKISQLINLQKQNTLKKQSLKAPFRGFGG
jgi:hypothetical protein